MYTKQKLVMIEALDRWKLILMLQLNGILRKDRMILTIMIAIKVTIGIEI